MLVLSRKEGERISIGDNITLIVSKVSGNRVTIGIEAPRDVKVIRSELRSDVAHEIEFETTQAISEPKARATLRDFAASVLPLQRQVG
jgi:carbon storage regulator